MTDYADLIARLRLMDGIGDVQLNELMNRKTPVVAADAMAALVARVAELESRLEVSPDHDIDGIAARDATIKLQDERIAELKSRLVEAEDATKAIHIRLGSLLERANERIENLEADVSHWKANHDNQVARARVLIERPDLPLERVEAYKRYSEIEAARDAWRDKYMFESGRMDSIKEKAGAMDTFQSNMIDSGVIDINVPPMFFSESIIPRLLKLAEMEKQEPVAWMCLATGYATTVAPSGKEEAGYEMVPLYAAPLVADPVRLTDEKVKTLYNRAGFNPFEMRESAHYFARTVETAVLRANGFKVKGEQ